MPSPQMMTERGVVRYFSAYVCGISLLLGFLSVVNMKTLLSLRGIWLLPLPAATQSLAWLNS